MDCAICMEKYDARVRRPMIIECGHTFCNICLEKILQKNSKCPFDSIIIKKPLGQISINYALEEMIENMQTLRIDPETPPENAKNEEIKQEHIIPVNLQLQPINLLQVTCLNQHVLELKNILDESRCEYCRRIIQEEK